MAQLKGSKNIGPRFLVPRRMCATFFLFALSCLTLHYLHQKYTNEVNKLVRRITATPVLHLSDIALLQVQASD